MQLKALGICSTDLGSRVMAQFMALGAIVSPELSFGRCCSCGYDRAVAVGRFAATFIAMVALML